MQSIFTGEKTPLICVPITARTKDELMNQLHKVLEQNPDVIEWRADFFAHLADKHQVIDMVQYLKEKTDKPLLFTIRSDKEGGEKIGLNEKEKVRLIRDVCEKTDVDIVDYEVENEEKYVKIVRDVTKKNDIELILSYHHFTKTPTNERLIKIGSLMEFYKADVAKIAVMPSTRADVIRLLSITERLEQLLHIPVITMSMGELGVLSRVIGWAFGSQLTFGVGVESSAPGQVPIIQLRKAIEAVQTVIPDNTPSK